MPNTTSTLHLYSDTSKFATGSALYEIQNGNPSLLHMQAKDYHKLQEIILLQN